MKDLDFNKVFQSARKSESRLYRKLIYWFTKRYFHCDIHPETQISDSVAFAHSALGVVINENAVIEENVLIQYHVTIGNVHGGTPVIRRGAYIGAHAMLLGNIVVGENVIIGANAVVTKDVPDGCTVVGNPMVILKKKDDC